MTAEPDIPHLLDRFAALCQQQGGRMTRHRRAVLRSLLVEKRPRSAYELRDMLRSEDASVTPASVYRCLDFLVEHGLVHRIETRKSFVACEHPDHPHTGQFLICRRCDTVVEVEDKRVAAATENLSHRLGFRLDHLTIELTGICTMCKTEVAGAANPCM